MRFEQMRRRKFMTLLAGTAAWSLAARAQQPTTPVIGFLGSPSAAEWAPFAAAFRQGLQETGYSRGRMRRSNTAGRMVNTSDYRSLLPIWLGDRWR